jgi:hypothetical protein
MKKLLIIISTKEEEKAITGMMYATNSLLHGWMEDVKLFIFGPAEELLLENERFREYVMDFFDMKKEVIACRFIAENRGLDQKIKEMGLQVEYVGEKISTLIHEGYIPMVW